MRRFQFTLLGLFGLTTCVALGCAALVQATALWCSAVAMAVIVVLFAAILGVVYRRGADRAFWVGFTVFGWGYLVLVYGPIVPIYSPENQTGVFGTSAVSSGPIQELYRVIHGEPPQSGGMGGMGGTGGGMFSIPAEKPKELQGEQNPFVDPSASPVPSPIPATASALVGMPGNAVDDAVRFGHFSNIANLLLSLVFALTGGVTARAFYATRERGAGSTEPGAGSTEQGAGSNTQGVRTGE